MADYLRLLLFPLAALSLAAALATPAPGLAAQQAAAPQADARVEEYVIGPEDVLEIAVWNNVEISRTVPVRPDGKISLPLLNDVQAAGLTPLQLRDRLAKALDAYIPGVAVSVIVREVHSFKVAVFGEVRSPGRYELRSRATVLDVLAMAGGLTEYADRGRIVVLRREGAKTTPIPFEYEKVTTANGQANGESANFVVRPGDIILVR